MKNPPTVNNARDNNRKWNNKIEGNQSYNLKKTKFHLTKRSSSRFNIMSSIRVGLFVVTFIISLIVLAQNWSVVKRKDYPLRRPPVEAYDESVDLNALAASANIKTEDLEDVQIVRTKLHTQQRINASKNKQRRVMAGYLNRPKQVTSDDSLPITMDKVKGIDFSLTRNNERLILSDEKQVTQRPRIVSKKLQQNELGLRNNQDLAKVKCHNNKFDRIIAQKMSMNNISKPIILSDGRFDNPFPTWKPLSYMDVFRFVLFEPDETSLPKNEEELNRELPMKRPYFYGQPDKNGSTHIETNSSDFVVTWIGHSTLLIQVDGLNILTDPVFSERASPSQMFGPKRYRPAASDIASLPRIDVVLISHDHYDHLDVDSVKDLNFRFPNIRWVVPVGIGQFMQSVGVENYVELTWWQKDCYHVGYQRQPSSDLSSKLDQSSSTSSSSSSSSTGQLTIASSSDNDNAQQTNESSQTPKAQKTVRLDLDIYFTPTQHWSRRSVLDVNKSLWGSFVIVSSNGSTFFFGGDTGYCLAFKEIGKIFGPFTGAAIPIGAYKPSWFMHYSHVDPQEAISIHRDIRSQSSISIHHGTFALANEFYLEPKRMLKKLMEYKNKNNKYPFYSLDHGDTAYFSKSKA